MTNYMKKIMIAITGALLLVTPALAECNLTSKADTQEQISKMDNVKSRMLTESEVKVLIDSKGAPPNAEEGVPVEMELVFNDDTAAINVYQKNCFINKLGPSRKQFIFNLLGLDA